MPTALRRSPRLRAHLELVRRHLLALRDALALASVLGRTLVVPRLPCLCDRSEAVTIIPSCVFEASDLELPFHCPISHILDLGRLLRMAGQPGGVPIRESTLLANPLAPRSLAAPGATVRVAIAANASAIAAMRLAGKAALSVATSDAEAKASLGRESRWGSAEAPDCRRLRACPPPKLTPRHYATQVLHLASAEGIFGGWADAASGGGGAAARDRFEQLMRAYVLGGSWCCSSWYKPHGAFDFAEPVSTSALPGGCGRDERVDEETAVCMRTQQRRRAAQRPFEFRYVPARGGSRARDGYFSLEVPSRAAEPP